MNSISADFNAVKKWLKELAENVQRFAQIPQQLNGIHKSIEQNTETINTTSAQEKTDKKTHEDRNYRVQNSIRWATWCAVIAASIYAGITYFQWRDAHKNFVINQRAWLGIDRPIAVNAFTGNSQHGGKISYTLTVKNFGNSVATDVVVISQPVSAIEAIEPAANYACAVGHGFSLATKKAIKVFNIPSGIDYPQKITGGVLFPADSVGYTSTDADIQTGKTEWGLTIVGCIVYRDQFDNERHTHFCYGGMLPETL